MLFLVNGVGMRHLVKLGPFFTLHTKTNPETLVSAADWVLMVTP